MLISQFTAAAPIIRRDPFEHPDYIFELKMDGFRALAYVGEYQTRLVSRKGNVYKSFTGLASAIHLGLDCPAVLDGEIVILDAEEGRSFTNCSGDVVARNESSMPSMCSGLMAKICAIGHCSSGSSYFGNSSLNNHLSSSTLITSSAMASSSSA